MNLNQVAKIGKRLTEYKLNGVWWIVGQDDSVREQLQSVLPEQEILSAPPHDEADPGACSILIVSPCAEGSEAEQATVIADLLARDDFCPFVVTLPGARTATVRKALRSAAYLDPIELDCGETGVEVFQPVGSEHKRHFDVAEYWEQRYRMGRDSGAGSYGRLARFKARFLNQFVKEFEVDSVVELGCGDGAQLALAEYPRFHGLDISPTIVSHCQSLFAGDDSKSFSVYRPDSFDAEACRADLALSLDVIYHLSNDKLYRSYLRDLFGCGKRFVVIYSNSDRAELAGVDESAGYLRFRDVLGDIKAWHPNWRLISATPNRFPYSAMQPSETSFSDFFVFAAPEESVAAGEHAQDILDRMALWKVLNSLVIADENRIRRDKIERQREQVLHDACKRIESHNSGQLERSEQQWRQVENELARLHDHLGETDRKGDRERQKAEDAINELRASFQSQSVEERQEQQLQKDLLQRIDRRLTRLESHHKGLVRTEGSTVRAVNRTDRHRERLAMVEQSSSYLIGRAVVDAFKKPGKNTLLLPFRVWRILRRNSLARAGQTSVTSSSRIWNDDTGVAQSGSTAAGAFHVVDVQVPAQPLWYSLNVSPGEAVRIAARLEGNGKAANPGREVVLLVECVGCEAALSLKEFLQLPYSRRLGRHFKYIPERDASEELISFEVPPGTHEIRLGLQTFFPGEGAQYLLRELSVAADGGAVIAQTTETPSAQSPLSGAFQIPGKETQRLGVLGWPELEGGDKPIVLGVMDEFTEGCFGPDARLVQPRPDNWYALAEMYSPDLVFVESAWKGNGGSWQYRVGSYNYAPGDEVRQLFSWAADSSVPSIFWNKEDPVHHDKFMQSAKLAEHIFTTDSNMIESYKERTGNQSVHALPFAAQPALHFPASIQDRIAACCFAGTWYGDRHVARGEAMKWLLDAALDFDLHIYDRNHGTGNFCFPERFESAVRGGLPYEELCERYRKYRVFLNVNSVVDSPTMFSRRVFELLACGTPVVSTPAFGIESILESGAVWLVETPEQAREAIHTLLNDDQEWRRRSLAGIREVFARHTYSHRINRIAEVVGGSWQLETDPRILLLAAVDSRSSMDNLVNFIAGQTYKNFLVAVSGEIDHSIPAHVRDQVVSHAPVSSSPQLARRHGADAIGAWSIELDYGPDYLRDLANAMQYAPDASGWGKSSGADRFSFSGSAYFGASIWSPEEYKKRDHMTARGRESVSGDRLYILDASQVQPKR